MDERDLIHYQSEFLATLRFKSTRYRQNVQELFNRVNKFLAGRAFNFETVNLYIDFLRATGLKRPWGDNGLHMEVQTIQQFTKFLYNERCFDRDWGLKLVKPKTFVPVHFTEISKELVLDLLKEATTPGPNDHILHRISKNEHYWALVFDFATGLRKTEIVQLKVKYLNLEAMAVIVPHPKGGNPKVTPISKWPWLFDELKKRVAEKGPEDRLFVVTSAKLRETMRKAKKIGNIPKEYIFSVHTLRHLFATDLYDDGDGANLFAINATLDHKELNTTKRYVHNNVGFKRRILDRYEYVTQKYKTTDDWMEEIVKETMKRGQVIEQKKLSDDTITKKR